MPLSDQVLFAHFPLAMSQAHGHQEFWVSAGELLQARG